MKQKTKLIIFVVLAACGIIAGYLLMRRTVSITVDGQTQEVTTHALTVRGALRSAGITLRKEDQVDPPAGSWLSKTTLITLDTARTVKIWIDPEGDVLEVKTSAKTPVEILGAAGIEPTLEDVTRVNGEFIALNGEITQTGNITLQYTPAVDIILNVDDQPQDVKSAAGTVAQMLWENGVSLRGGDALEPSMYTALNGLSAVGLRHAVPLIITVDGRDIETYAGAATVGEALIQAGISLQDLDYSQPAETDPLPADGRIKVIRVREEVLLEQESLAYETEQVADDTLELDQTAVKQTGEYGIQASRVRVRYEDGVEVSRQPESTVVLKEPVNQITAYGTKITLQTMDTPDGTITYYRALTVTATTYKPCSETECIYGTAMGTKVQKGVAAVNLSWYRLLKNTKVYVPGYGIAVIQDTGSYPYNNNWIDLGYTEEQYAQLSNTEKYFGSITIYFLAPFPDSQPWILP